MFKKNNYFNLDSNSFQVILADPPWDFQTFSNKGKDRGAEKHYNIMSIDQMKALPVMSLAADRCALFLWVTDTHLKIGLDVMESWGFEFKTVGFHWSKICRKSWNLTTGLGYYTRANSEICLLGVPAGGKAPIRKSKGVHRTMIEADENALLELNDKLEFFKGNVASSVAIISRIREHSRKPEEQYDRIEKLFDGPYCELFARHERKNWSSWGDQLC